MLNITLILSKQEEKKKELINKVINDMSKLGIKELEVVENLTNILVKNYSYTNTTCSHKSIV